MTAIVLKGHLFILAEVGLLSMTANYNDLNMNWHWDNADTLATSAVTCVGMAHYYGGRWFILIMMS